MPKNPKNPEADEESSQPLKPDPESKPTLFLGKDGELSSMGYSVEPRGGATEESGEELQEIEDVFVLLPEDETSFVSDSGGGYGAGGGFAGSGMESDDTTRAEDVGLLTSHPEFAGDHGGQALPEISAAEIEDLPSLEDVEDITALVEQVSGGAMESPSEVLGAPFAGRADAGGRRRFLLIPLGAVAALLLAAVYFFPDTYRSTLDWISDGGVASASSDGSSDPSDAGANPDRSNAGGPGGAVSTSQQQTEELRDWLGAALTNNLGAPPGADRR
ncbi:MAG: hypothetical protein ACE5GW_04925 [Planctomycetota bacterium]